MTGTVERLHDNGHTGSIHGDDDHRYYLYRGNLQRLQAHTWEDVRVGTRVSFGIAESGHARDQPRAIEVLIDDAAPLDGV
jgi:hypothetical protein